MYRIREVDASDDEISEMIEHLHRATSDFPALEQSDYDEGHWWIGYLDNDPVSYAGVIPSSMYPSSGYFKRVGVLSGHRGNGLQLRHMKAIERKAKSLGWAMIVSDTTGNTPSANNFIRAGYRLFDPTYVWAFQHTLYWKKDLNA
ncbi:GNAT family N-acetyltransferase [Bradyrhizobium genosp. L]|nr:GNAT family N-acetyltransferase [Bradyrhizobium genosp. L]QPF88075.1 GNAT family N-acetyltransferase [Bradyrhizobium genosp. L]